ncbi:MAG TPA: hypothetical protein VKV69_11545 [Actinomycetota bacterium]|nr:hypothetical protein [Actinomycetota bacterium]
MIATSVLFLAAAIATFLVGVFSTGLQMIGASIGCSVAAAVLLLVGVMRDSRKRPAIAPNGMSVSAPEMESIVAPAMPERYAELEPVPALETEFSSAEPLDLESAREDFYGTPETESYDIAPTSAPVTRARKPAARKPAARKPAARKPAAKSAAKKAAPKKAAARKPAAKSAAKKAAPKKAAPRKSSSR